MENFFYSENDYYYSQNEEMSDSLAQNWTKQALECYYLNCNCKKCSISAGNYSFICQMPKVITSLIETVGVPKEDKIA